MTRSLLLFDIDGTLLITKGAGSRCLQRAGRIVFGDGFTWTDVTVGLIDPQIFAQLAEHNRINNADAQLDRFRETYLSELRTELAHRHEDVTLMPGIPALLDRLRRRSETEGDVALGLLTGNFRAAAHLKLLAAGLDLGWFPVSVFAEDGASRNDLPRVAMRRAAEHLGSPIPPHRVLIIGDTPRDIECAHANGCLAVSVATGRYSMKQLREHGGDLVCDSLADPAPLLDLLDM